MVVVKEPYELVKIKNGKEVNRESYVEEIGYCDECGKEIPDYPKTYQVKNQCCICGKQICDDHSNPYPNEEFQVKMYGDPEVICERCNTLYSKEIAEYILYLKTLKNLEKTLENFKDGYGNKELKGFQCQHISCHIKNMGKELKEKQKRINSDKARRMQKKIQLPEKS